MMVLLNLALFLVFQNPAPPAAPRVVVGLVDDQQLVVENPKFSGFIETRDRDGEAVLMYRQEHFHGELSISSVSRIDFGEYKKGKPLDLTVTLRNGQKLEVQAERRDYVTVQGKTDVGTITIKHPDPASSVT